MVTVVKMRMCTVHLLHMHTKNYSLSTYNTVTLTDANAKFYIS